MNCLMYSDVDLQILERLAFAQLHGRSIALRELATDLGVSAPLVSQRLKRLREDGVVASTDHRLAHGRRGITVVGGVRIQWVSAAAGLAEEWSCHGEVDWEFPLATQVQHRPARETLVRFLRALKYADDGNLLDPGRVLDRSRSVRHAGLDIVAYGSAARGDARPGSDLDLVVLHGVGPSRLVERVRDTAADVSLESGVAIQLHIASGAALLTSKAPVPEWLDEAVARDGVLAYNGLRGGPDVPAPTPTVGWVYWRRRA